MREGTNRERENKSDTSVNPFTSKPVIWKAEGMFYSVILIQYKWGRYRKHEGTNEEKKKKERENKSNTRDKEYEERFSQEDFSEDSEKLSTHRCAEVNQLRPANSIGVHKVIKPCRMGPFESSDNVQQAGMQARTTKNSYDREEVFFIVDFKSGQFAGWSKKIVWRQEEETNFNYRILQTRCRFCQVA